MSMNSINLLGDETWRELGQASDIGAASVAFWLRTNIGALNNLIGTEYVIDSTYEISPELGDNEKVILKKLYFIYYYGKKITEALSAASSDTLLEVSSDGATIRTASKTEISKTYISLKKAEQEDLDNLVKSYLSNLVTPLQVYGGDVCIPLTYETVYVRD